MWNKRIFCFIVYFLILFISISAFASPGADKKYLCRRLAQEPLLDGKVKEDPAWEKVSVDNNFVKLGCKEPASKQTYFRIGYTPEALFISVECEEPEPRKIKAVLPDNQLLYLEDSIEVFVLPKGCEYFHQFVVNAIGSRWNCIAQKEISLAGWQANTYIGENYWSVELKFPFSILGAIPEKNEEWKINICRNIFSSGEHEYTTWTYMNISFHESQNFGTLVFADEISPEEKRKIETKFNENIFLFSKSLVGTFLAKEGREERISFWNGSHVAPRLSPDTKRILLHSTKEGKIGIWLTDLHGEKMERVCDGEQAEWSPDGKKIVFVREGRIIEKEIISGKERIVSPVDWSSCRFPSYLPGVPNGRIIFVLKKEKNDEVYLISPDEKITSELLIKGEIGSTPKCSLDGKNLAYQNGAHIYLMDLESKQISQLTRAPGVQSWPMWSKDGKSICFCQSPGFFDGPWDIYNVEIKNPETMGLVKRDRFLNIASDWSGFSPPTTSKIEIKGKNIGFKQEKDEIIIENEILKNNTFVEIKPAKGIDKIYLKRNINLILLPDRFSNDLIFDGANADSRILLSHTPFLLGLLAKEEAILMVITSSDNQTIELIKNKGKDFFGEMQISTKGESIFMSLLSQKDFMFQKEIKPTDTNEWKIEWDYPFLAQWRAAVCGKKNYSRMWGEEDLNKLKGDYLPIEEKFLEQPEIAIVYTYDRSWHTPLDILTPGDILRDALDIKRYKEVLDIEGIRNYRTCDEWVPFLEFPVYFEWLDKIRAVKRKGVEPTITHLCNDVLNLLKGLDKRLKEYQDFVVELENFCKKHEFFDFVKEDIESIQKKSANLSVTEIDKFSNSIDKIKTGNFSKEEFKKLASDALSKRQKILLEYRKSVKKLREKAGLIITKEPKLKNTAEEIRERTQKILRKRFYLEGDWQGEDPLHEEK